MSFIPIYSIHPSALIQAGGDSAIAWLALGGMSIHLSLGVS